MFEEYAGVRILKVFIDDPAREIHLREAANLAKVSPGSAKKYLDMLHEERLLSRTKKANLLLYRGNLENPAFKRMRVAHSVYGIMKCGLVDYLISEMAPASITLFGSAARGEDDKNSDVDLFVLAKKRELDVSRFEKTMKRRINLIAYDPKTWERKAREDRPFYEAVTFSGVVLLGELPVI